MTRAVFLTVAAIALLEPSAAASRGHFPTGTFVTKITAADLYRAGLDPSDAHWEKVTYRVEHIPAREDPFAHATRAAVLAANDPTLLVASARR